MINFYRHKIIYLLISLAILIPGAFSLVKNGLRLSIDFTGGTLVQYSFSEVPSSQDLQSILDKAGFPPQSITLSGNSAVIKFPNFKDMTDSRLNQILKENFTDPKEESFETLGPVLGRELQKKTLIGISLATFLILLYIAYAFKSFKFGFCATLATLHDSLVLLGIFSWLGVLWHVEIDSLFVTALLTVLSFSVHDTIVVFDRIRELQKVHKTDPLEALATLSVNQTVIRSLNNSLTIIFMLTALLLLGGPTIRWFTVALLVGTVSGTYSSPFVAVPLLLYWDKFFSKHAD